MAIGIVTAFFFKITPRTHAVLMKELERLRSGGNKSDADAESRAVAEKLTGIPYDKLYTK